MSLYSLIQFCSILILYTVSSSGAPHTLDQHVAAIHIMRPESVQWDLETIRINVQNIYIWTLFGSKSVPKTRQRGSSACFSAWLQPKSHSVQTLSWIHHFLSKCTSLLLSWRILPSPALLKELPVKRDFLMCVVQVKTTMADLQFLVCDIFLVTVLAIMMGRGGPSKELHSRRPAASLLTLPVLGSLFIHTCMIILGQLAALFITTSQDWSVKKNIALYFLLNSLNRILIGYLTWCTLIHCKTYRFFFLGIFHSIPQCMEQPTYPTWRTLLCFPCQVTNTSSWLWWSPRATLTRNLSTTMVSHHKCPRMRISSWKNDACWQIGRILVVRLVKLEPWTQKWCFLLLSFQWSSSVCCSSFLPWWLGWCCILGLLFDNNLSCMTSLIWVSNCSSSLWLLSISSFVLLWR